MSVDECTFHYLNFLIIGMSNSSAYSWFDIIFLLRAPPEADLSVSKADILSKIYKPSKQDLFDIHHILDFFATINVLSCNILSEAVLLGKSFKSL